MSDERTAEQVVALVRAEAGLRNHADVLDRSFANRVLAALADAGLVVCAEGEANHNGQKITLTTRVHERYGFLPGVTYRADVPGDPDPRCPRDVGRRPDWMGPDQYDPCRCVLDAGHDGPHKCRHSDDPPTPSDEGAET